MESVSFLLAVLVPILPACQPHFLFLNTYNVYFYFVFLPLPPSPRTVCEGIPVAQQHLIWNNLELDDEHCLHDYG